jgi:hypothetical protein
VNWKEVSGPSLFHVEMRPCGREMLQKKSLDANAYRNSRSKARCWSGFATKYRNCSNQKGRVCLVDGT